MKRFFLKSLIRSFRPSLTPQTVRSVFQVPAFNSSMALM